jgi:phage tail-like protein
MTCVSGEPTFRLLDARVGWDPSTITDLTGVDLDTGLRLALAGGEPDPPTAPDLLPWFSDPRLAPGCGRCSWYLLAPDRGLLRRRVCGDPDHAWAPVWPPGCGPGILAAPTAVAARGHRFAVVDRDRVLVWDGEGERLAAVIPGPAVAVALTSWGELLVVRPGGNDLERYDAAGERLGRLRTCVPGHIEDVVVGRRWTIWVRSRDGDRRALWRGHRHGGAFVPTTPAKLARWADRTALTATSELGFCLTEPGADGMPAQHCFTWEGERLEGTEVGAPAPPASAASGELVTSALDSGIPRCRWHRVRLDADVPAGTSVDAAVATNEQPGGAPLPGDWQDAPPGSLDFLVEQPPGRYLFVRLRLRGDGATSPTVRGVRLDFPRVTSIDLLPPVYRRDPAADDFTERFLALFDASLGSLDRVVERYPALLDARGVPDEVLPWLGGFLGLAFDPGWDSATRRALLTAAPELYRRRGTPWALTETVRIVFKVVPVIEELARERNWAVVGGGSRLSSARLFGRSTARFRLGGSALGRAPVRGFGNPDEDAVTAQAHRFRVFVPPVPGQPAPDPAVVARLVEDQAPAHTVAQIRLGGYGFVVGSSSRIGVDTALVPLPAPVVGPVPTGRGRSARLNRDSVLRSGVRGRPCGVRVGLRSAVAVNTVAE